MKPSNNYIILTGAAGFIGSCTAAYLNELGYENLIQVDDFGIEAKRKNWEGKSYSHIVERYNLFDWLELHEPKIDFVIHLGARTDTSEFDYAIHQELNVEYSQDIWRYCTEKQVPLIYASSAATYGNGEFGYDDNHELPYKLQPLNPYGISKNEFDKWALEQAFDKNPMIDDSEENHQRPTAPPFWAGLKFFNVYGPNEYHKGRMASVIWHAFNQIKNDGEVKLFKSHRPDFEAGEQLRDFIYVKDVIKVIGWMMEKVISIAIGSQWSIVSKLEEIDLSSHTSHDSRFTIHDSPLTPGLYNLGTGHARSFYDLAANTFTAQRLSPNIRFIDIPEDIRDKYQYFTEANMQKLTDAGYTDAFYSLEDGIADYVQQYLVTGSYM